MVLIVLLLQCTLNLLAQTSEHTFMRYSAADGLADNSAHTIHCTKTGRMVITTMGQMMDKNFRISILLMRKSIHCLLILVIIICISINSIIYG